MVYTKNEFGCAPMNAEALRTAGVWKRKVGMPHKEPTALRITGVQGKNQPNAGYVAEEGNNP